MTMIAHVRFTFRPLTADDAGAFKALRLYAIATSPSAVWPTSAEEVASDAALRITQTDTQIVFGAFQGADLVAIAGLRREPLRQVRHKATLWGVFVDPVCRSLGLARQLFAHLSTHARNAGVLQIQLSVNADNTAAKALYRSFGFITYGREPRAMCVEGIFHDEEHMQLQLDT